MGICRPPEGATAADILLVYGCFSKVGCYGLNLTVWFDENEIIGIVGTTSGVRGTF